MKQTFTINRHQQRSCKQTINEIFDPLANNKCKWVYGSGIDTNEKYLWRNFWCVCESVQLACSFDRCCILCVWSVFLLSLHRFTHFSLLSNTSPPHNWNHTVSCCSFSKELCWWFWWFWWITTSTKSSRKTIDLYRRREFRFDARWYTKTTSFRSIDAMMKLPNQFQED